MHNNYYFLRQLSTELAKQLTGFTLVSCFSQNKDELIIEFNDAKKSFFLKATLQPEFQCLSFPDAFHRAKKNSVDIFNNILMKKVIGVRQFLNERSFALLLEHDNTLVFKMHGARANVICFDGDSSQEIFRNNFTADLELKINELDRTIDWRFEAFLQYESDLPQYYFTFGKPLWKYLNKQNFQGLASQDKWNLIQETLHQLEKPAYHIIDDEGTTSLSLLNSGHGIRTFSNPMMAVSEFFHLKISTTALQKERTTALAIVNGKLKQAESYAEKNKQKIEELEIDHHYQQWADLIMANLSKIKIGLEKITVDNFYDAGKPVEIKLKKELNPQMNAAAFYKKSKNQTIEMRTLKDSLAKKEKEIDQLKDWKQTILDAQSVADFKTISTALAKKTVGQKNVLALPYHEFEFKGFKIWVGKNAISNDELTQKYSFKEDLWLHAKDVAGSHVLIKYRAAKPFPKDVIERAASLAAYYSKRKNESLCPITVTPKKFVRKRKGDPVGAVVVEREEVLLVTPGR